MRYEIRVVEGNNSRSGKLLGVDNRPGRALQRARKVAYDYHYGVVVVDVTRERANWGYGWDNGLVFNPDTTATAAGEV